MRLPRKWQGADGGGERRSLASRHEQAAQVRPGRGDGRRIGQPADGATREGTRTRDRSVRRPRGSGRQSRGGTRARGGATDGAWAVDPLKRPVASSNGAAV